MKTGYDCKNRYWIEKEIHKNGIDYTGQHHRRLTFLFPVTIETDTKHSHWLLQCDCGNLLVARPDSVLHGSTYSCGCLNSELSRERNTEDLTGQKFGMLTCLKRISITNQPTKYECLCECGNTVTVINTSLKNGNTKSCGCLISWKEKEISDILTRLHIKFQTQYRIPECKDKLPLPFDFIIYNGNYYGLIEYQGSQHYIQSQEWDSLQDFQIRQQHDKIKLDYCNNNHIPLLILDKSHNLEDEILSFYINMRNG